MPTLLQHPYSCRLVQLHHVRGLKQVLLLVPDRVKRTPDGRADRRSCKQNDTSEKRHTRSDAEPENHGSQRDGRVA